jgi:hypothetical protein
MQYRFVYLMFLASLALFALPLGMILAGITVHWTSAHGRTFGQFLPEWLVMAGYFVIAGSCLCISGCASLKVFIRDFRRHKLRQGREKGTF